MPSIISRYPSTPAQRRVVSLARNVRTDAQPSSSNSPKKTPTQPFDNFKPEGEFVLVYKLSTKPVHSTSKALMCLLNNFEAVEMAGVVRKGRERNEDAQTFYVYLAVNQADLDPGSFELWNTPPSDVLFPTNTSGDNPDDGTGTGAFRFADDPSNNPTPPDTTDEALAIFADQIGDQKDPVDFRANFDIVVSGSFNDPRKGDTRVVTINGIPFAINDPSVGGVG